MRIYITGETGCCLDLANVKTITRLSEVHQDEKPGAPIVSAKFSAFMGDDIEIAFTTSTAPHIPMLERFYAELTALFLDQTKARVVQVIPGFALAVGKSKDDKLLGMLDGFMSSARESMSDAHAYHEGRLNPLGLPTEAVAAPGDWQVSLQLLMGSIDSAVATRDPSDQNVQALIEAMRAEVPGLADKILGPAKSAQAVN